MEYIRVGSIYYPMSSVIFKVVEDNRNNSLILKLEVIGQAGSSISLGDIGANGQNDDSIPKLINKFKHTF